MPDPSDATAESTAAFPERVRRARERIADGRDPDDVMGELRAHARAKGWSVMAALYDLGPLDRPKGERSALTRVTRLLEDGKADGIVTLDEGHLVGNAARPRASIKRGRTSVGAGGPGSG
ncbi:hypothetical protein AB0G73_01820 [Streptomyces sp. NPDC020719]|uniref:hypothetical protein n=1 Tax=Streptomyces sp. NPDC020719 TaxID=3154896 RepID=UPI00340D7FF5